MTARINIPKPKPPTQPRKHTQAIPAHLAGHPTASLSTVWTYDTRDPHAVQIDFRQEKNTTWLFDRSLLLDGLTSPAGEMDVQVFPSDDSQHVIIRLRVPGEGQADIAFPIEDVRQFRNITYGMVQVGAEPEQIVPGVESFLRKAAEHLGGDS
ncbi:SsgA family sporulation/cell division regulator [Amycolatopsis thailandensis]|uniref:SsgA family sporulation/cell division regulator n=1 Tax=Amycolatopsis thailandensis TaxID=589330 RepID=UPI0036541F18